MGASFARTDSQKKQHKERAQPFNRQRYGLLEKKKDYVLRSADYKQKQARLKTLRSKIANKNEDEFYFGMVSGRTKKGVAVKDRGNTALAQDVTKVLKTQDAAYIKTVAAIERKKVQQLAQAQHLPRRDTEVEDEDEESGAARGKGVARRRTHAVFVDSAADLQTLDPATRLHTTPHHLSRVENRLPTDVARDTTHESADARLLRRQNARQRRMLERESESRAKRLAKLGVMERETQLHRDLQTKGMRRKVGTDKDGVARYKWKQERKR